MCHMHHGLLLLRYHVLPGGPTYKKRVYVQLHIQFSVPGVVL